MQALCLKVKSLGSILIEDLEKGFENRRHQERSADELHPFGATIPVLDGINLEIEDGEMVCILGPSGCGKSTLLRIIAGFDQPSGGSLSIDGNAVTGPSPDNIFVFQHSGLLPWMTVKQNVEIGLRHMKNFDEKEEQVREYIQMVDLDGFEDHYPHQLSGGMQRRAELARALVVNPNILFMDEPFAALDFLTHMKMREEVVNMHEYFRKTNLVVTHDIDDALIMGDRVVIMSDRPSKIKLNRKLDFPHPRTHEKQPELKDLRDDIFLMLGIAYAV